MNSSRHVLITRPEHDLTTRYLAKWSEEIVAEAKSKHHDVVDLKAKKATRERFIGTMQKTNPRLVVLNGHGDEDRVGGHDDEILLSGPDGVVKDKIIYARACKSAKRLGPQTVANGASAYVGYDEDFVFVIDEEKSSRPLRDKTAALFLGPSNHAALSLLRGHTVAEANQHSRSQFARNIQALILRGPSDDDYYAIRHLLWDLRHQVSLGDGAAGL